MTIIETVQDQTTGKWHINCPFCNHQGAVWPEDAVISVKLKCGSVESNLVGCGAAIRVKMRQGPLLITEWTPSGANHALSQ
jgi:hypothetical protein